MTLQEITKIMAILATEYENFQISEERIGLWHEIIGYANYKESLQAVKYFLTTDSAFPPKVGQINQEILSNRRSNQLALQANKPVLRLPEPEPISEEKRKKNIEMLRELTINLANKKEIQ